MQRCQQLLLHLGQIVSIHAQALEVLPRAALHLQVASFRTGRVGWGMALGRAARGTDERRQAGPQKTGRRESPGDWTRDSRRLDERQQESGSETAGDWKRDGKRDSAGD